MWDIGLKFSHLRPHLQDRSWQSIPTLPSLPPPPADRLHSSTWQCSRSSGLCSDPEWNSFPPHLYPLFSCSCRERRHYNKYLPIRHQLEDFPLPGVSWFPKWRPNLETQTGNCAEWVTELGGWLLGGRGHFLCSNCITKVVSTAPPNMFKGCIKPIK